MSYQSFLQWKINVEDQLKKDDIETALDTIFHFIESNESYYNSKMPRSLSIGLMASLKRQKDAFRKNIIDWDKVNLERSKLIHRCLDVLEILEEDLKGEYEKRSYPGISGPPAALRLSRAIQSVEDFLASNLRAV
jgi:hypothetical protein